MKLPDGWKTGFIYIVIIITLGLTALTYGFARLEPMPKGQEVVAQDKTQAQDQWTEGRMDGRLETQIEDSEELKGSTEAESVNQGVNGAVNQAVNEEGKREQEIGSLSASVDFPSPVHVPPLRGVGNYFSESLNAFIYHAGRDYPLAEGAIIRATHGGKVTFADADPILGQKVEIDCGEDWRVVYGGLDNLRVQAGEIIEKNAVLGQIGYHSGADGINDRTQLHYEVWQGEKALGGIK